MFRMHKCKDNFEPNEKVEKEIKTSVHISKDSFDVESLYDNVRFILKRSIRTSDTHILKKSLPEGDEEEPKPKGSFRLPICFLKKIISSELLSCKDQPDSKEIAHKTAVNILKKVEDCTWMGKAVLSVAVFAKDYGDFNEYHRMHDLNNGDQGSSDQLTESLAFLKGWLIPLKKHKDEIEELNALIRETLQLMKTIKELEMLSHTTRSMNIDNNADLILPDDVDYYWIIMAVIACENKFTTILRSSDQDKPYSLKPFIEKVQSRFIDLKKKQAAFENMKAEDIRFYELMKLSKSPMTSVTKILTPLVSTDDSSPLQLFDGSKETQNTVTLDTVLEKKKKLFLVLGSEENLSDDDIDLLRRIHSEKIKESSRRVDEEKEQCAIVWLPIADKDHHGNLNSTDESFLRSKKIEWYTLNKTISDQGTLKFLEQKWDYTSSRPSVVVMDVPTAKIETTDALHAMRLWGVHAFPYDHDSLQLKRTEMSFLFNDFHYLSQELTNSVQNDEYIILHGGTDQSQAKEIEDQINMINTNLVEVKIKHFNINQEKVEVSFEDLFWRGVDCCPIKSTKLQNESHNEMEKQLDRLCSFRKDKVGWFVLNRGPVTVVVGSGQTLLEMVNKIHLWKKNVEKKTFEVAFKEFHENIFESQYKDKGIDSKNKTTSAKDNNSEDCCIIEYPTEEGKLRINVDCPNCHQLIKKNIIVAYKCQK